MIRLPADFKEFLRLLNDRSVEYLLVGGHAVGLHGYPRATAEMDVWVAVNPQNADQLTEAVKEFGFAVPDLNPSMFLGKGKIIRMGLPPLRIEIMTDITGVQFEDCYQRRMVAEIEGVQVPYIHLEDLKVNKKAAGRLKDLNDLENLP